jgi:hypothetical protein
MKLSFQWRWRELYHHLQLQLSSFVGSINSRVRHGQQSPPAQETIPESTTSQAEALPKDERKRKIITDLLCTISDAQLFNGVLIVNMARKSSPIWEHYSRKMLTFIL